MGIIVKYDQSFKMPTRKKKVLAETTTVETTKEVSGKTIFSFTQPTPHWATWVFRVEFIMNKALVMWLSATSLVETSKLKETFLILSIADFVTWFFARSLGVKKEDIDK